MAYTFKQALAAFRNDQIQELSQDADGIRFLKFRSLSRAEHMRRLIADHGLAAPDVNSNELLRFLFESEVSNDQIESTIRSIYAQERTIRAAREDELISELYRLTVFDWGGLHQNSLEKTIVDNYVKKIRSYEDLERKIENELLNSMRGYVLCSWYNHWTSIIIEDVFRDHDSVLPAVGLVKKVDFFIRDVPFDLKVTYMPEGFVKDKRRLSDLPPELTLLKRFCRAHGIHFSRDLPEAHLLGDLWAKVSDYPSPEATQLIRQLKTNRLEFLHESIHDPAELIRWLYENQGVRRFDASNRLFLVLVDCGNFFDSWKLKRAKPLLVDRIHSHLNEMHAGGIEVDFEWDGQSYNVKSDIVFVTHNDEGE